MNKERKYYIITIILLIIIVLILIYFNTIDKKEKQIPTGNQDIFNIDVEFPNDKNVLGVSENNFNINSDVAEGQEKKEEIIKYTKIGEQKGKGEITKYTEEAEDGKVYVDDTNGKYIYQQNLRIFENVAYGYTNMISPGVSNTYEFTVHNSSKINVKYNLQMYEKSLYKVNLKYRLRKNGNYVLGNEDTWISVDELNTELSQLNKSTSDMYSLDWKWFDDDENDNIAGKNMKEEYKLNIKIYFEMVDE